MIRRPASIFLYTILTIIIGSLILVSQFRFRSPDISPLENIDGIHFWTEGTTTLVTEKLAHADIYLTQPPLATSAVISITFTPQNIDRLFVGIRDNEFWLSYQKHLLYDTTTDNQSQPHTRTLTIPLTDKLTDQDGSLDLMFFAETAQDSREVDDGISDRVEWSLHNLAITLKPSLPPTPQLKDYLRSLITRERPL